MKKYDINNFELTTVITLDNVKEILADMGVEYTLKKYAKVASVPSIYKDGKAYEIKNVHNMGYRKGASHTPNSRMFLVGKTIQEVLDFLNEEPKGKKNDRENTSAANYIQRPNLKAAAHITIDNNNKPIVEVTGVRATSMETMRSIDPKRAELIDHIFYGPKKRGFERRPSKNRVSDHCKPVYNVTTGELSYKATFSTPANHLKYSVSAYNAELLAITKSCEYNKPTPAGNKPYSNQQFQWAAEMPLERLEEILRTIKEAKCRTYADYKKKLAKEKAKEFNNNLTQVVNNINGGMDATIAMEILTQLKKLSEGIDKLTASLK